MSRLNSEKKTTPPTPPSIEGGELLVSSVNQSLVSIEGEKFTALSGNQSPPSIEGGVGGVALIILLVLIAFPIQAQTSVPDSLANAWSAGPSWGQFLKVLLILGFILVLIWLTVTGLKKLGGKVGGKLRGVELIGGLPLGPRRSLMFVKIGQAYYVIGATDHHIGLITELKDPAEIEAITSSGMPQATFGDVLKRMSGKGSGN